MKLHQLQTDPIPYRTINPFAENNRYLYFFSDVPEKEGESGFFAHTLDAPLHAVIMGSTLYRAMHALLEEDTKILNTSASVAVHAMAESVCRWLITHPKETTSMEKKINSHVAEMHAKVQKLKATSDVVMLSQATHIIRVCYCTEAVSRWYCRRESSAFSKGLPICRALHV